MVEIKIKRVKQGSAIIISDETRDPETDELTTPDGGVAVTITDPDGTDVVDGSAMSETTTGKWILSYQIAADAVKGMYTVTTAATHGGKATKKEDRKAFEVY